MVTHTHPDLVWLRSYDHYEDAEQMRGFLVGHGVAGVIVFVDFLPSLKNHKWPGFTAPGIKAPPWQEMCILSERKAHKFCAAQT